ncbi:hypothetical protein SAMN05421823_105316 [Catalinimonas alkaloidigena]|uniref:Outer membrane protein beta-barrel domain-containing protein n=1 Tax=Catalinimonas alkaloidigena TaxID=1075417 RepID=A0A1G9JHI5_9BACT|nr:hypothetical protein [Catalinimonas alkaloidigena]SDL36861.1 hypothetical protein SAMN05421823_105316 [Catalinimonas alkaloidigena]
MRSTSTFFVCFCAFLLFSLTAKSQSADVARNTVYFEAGGAAFFYSLNYERLLFKSSDQNLAVRVGFTGVPMFDRRRHVLGVPVGASYLNRLRASNKYLELGVSVAGLLDRYDSTPEPQTAGYERNELVAIPSIRAGLRKQPQGRGLFWNALLQASLLAVDDASHFSFAQAEKQVLPFLSAGLGYSF